MRKSTLLGGVALGVTLALGLGAAAQAQDLTVAWKGAPEFTNDDVKFKVRGRIYTDYVFQEIDGEYDPVTNVGGTGDYNTRNGRLRTARLGVEGQWNSQWAYKAEVNFVAGNTVQWDDLILEYKPNDTTSIMIGNFKTVSLENIGSSRYNTFMERGAFNDVLDIGRVLNVAAKMNGINWTLMAAVSGDSLNTADIAGEERLGWSIRGTYAPIDTDTTKLHLGLWVRGRDFGDEGLPAKRPGSTTASRCRANTRTSKPTSAASSSRRAPSIPARKARIKAKSTPTTSRPAGSRPAKCAVTKPTAASSTARAS
jgi:phosphate-selective porin OprO/OprP